MDSVAIFRIVVTAQGVVARDRAHRCDPHLVLIRVGEVAMISLEPGRQRGNAADQARVLMGRIQERYWA